eukprot:442457-Pleurochrysis_carterae.AAC.1
MFTWQAVGLFESYRRLKAKYPLHMARTNITRLLACDPDQLRTFQGLKIGPTFVHKNLRFGGHPSVKELGYPSYNKPGSIVYWMNEAQPQERGRI